VLFLFFTFKVLQLIVIFTQFNIVATTCRYALGARFTIFDPVRAECDLRVMDHSRIQMKLTSHEEVAFCLVELFVAVSHHRDVLVHCSWVFNFHPVF